MYNYTKEGLQNLGIYELRSVARQVGVYSPSTLKKEEIINKILAVINGKEEPYVRIHKQGRPAKNISNLNEMLNIFVPNGFSVSNKPYKRNFDIPSQFDTKFMQELETIPEGKVAFKGYFKPQDTNFGIIFKSGYYNGNQNDTYFIPQKLVTLFHLKAGDLVEGLYNVIADDKPLIVTNITVINGVYTTSMQERLSFEDLDAIYPTKQISFSNSNKIDLNIMDRIAPIGFGARSLINYDSDFDPTDYTVEMLNQISLTNNIKTIYISVDDRPEYLNDVRSRSHGVEFVYNKGNLAIEQFVELIDLKIKNAIRLVENGDHYVIVFSNADKLFTLLQSYYLLNSQSTEQQAKIFASKRMREYLMYAKNTQKNLSLTLFAAHCHNEDLQGLFNQTLYFNSVPYAQTDIYLDLEKSSTLKSNLILSKEQSEALNRFRSEVDYQNPKPYLEKLFLVK